jgi:plasmid stabilization system protein ParE
MSLALIFRPSARAEFDAAADWYEHQWPGLGAKFTAAVEVVLDRIVEQPDFYPAVFEDIREALVKTYPYCVYYRLRTGYVSVIAVLHTARDPAIWQSRV